MRRRARGFTLIEVLISLVLLSLIMGGLLASLRTLGDTATRLDERSARTEELRLVSGFLRQLIGGMVAKPLRLSADAPPLLLLGAATELVWVAPMPVHHGVGGLHRFRLSRGGTTDPALLLHFTPYTGDEGLPDWSRQEPRLLLEGLQQLELAYQATGTPEWQSQWTDPQRLPARIRLRLAQPERHWPELVIALHGSPAQGVSFGGSR